MSPSSSLDIMDSRLFVSDEVATYWRYIAQSIDDLLALMDGLDAAQLNWRPPAPDANSLYALATHTMGSTEQKLLSTLCGWPVTRDRQAEFASVGESPLTIRRHWVTLRGRIEEALGNMGPDDLAAPYEHPGRGQVSGREVLLLVARHTAEHHAHAQLTRDLLLAR
jgi:hypothetical protein